MLKIIARELNIPILVSSGIPHPPARPVIQNSYSLLADFRKYRILEQNADVTIILYRDKTAVECLVAENYYGEIGTIPLKWNDEFMTFEDVHVDIASI